MKFFSAKKKDEKDTKTDGDSSEDNSDISVESTDAPKIKPSRDSDSKQKSMFDSFRDSKDKLKQSESKVTTIKADPKSSKIVNKEKTVIEGIDQKKAEAKDQLVSNNPTGQQSTVQSDEISTNDYEVRKVIRIISENKNHTISPFINFDENRLLYPSLAQIGDYEHVMSLLEKLSSPSINILEKGIYEKLPVCPDHSDSIFCSLRLYCSSCFATDIIKLHLIEHKVCGYITEIRDSHGEGADISKCISCKNLIKDPVKEIRRLGRWYECNKCKVKFDNCVIKLHCRKFDHDFDINQANMISIPSYNLKIDGKSTQVYSLSLIPQIQQILQSYGFTVEESSEVKGKSGVGHKTSIYAHNNENKVVIIDIKSSEKNIDDTEVNSMIVEVLDISPDISIFIGIPSVSEAAKTMAAAQNISVVTGNNLTEIISTVEQILKTRLHLNKEFRKT